MAQDKLEPGGRPKKNLLEPVKGPDGIYRLDRVRHRRFNGTYTRTSASGFTRKECLKEWEDAFERKRREGSARRATQRQQLSVADPMVAAFDQYFEFLDKRVAAGKITQKTRDLYHAATYRVDSARANPDAIRLDTEMGQLSIAEAGKPSFLHEYLEDVTAIVPGIAAHQFKVLKGTFNMLTRAGLFDVSPMAPITMPESAEPNQRALFPEECLQLYGQIVVTVTRAKWFRIMFLLILGTGIRPGEAAALWWSDCPDLDDDTVDKAVLRIAGTGVKPLKGGPVFRQDKRKNGRRGRGYYITLPRWLTAELRAYKRVCAPESQDSPMLVSLRGGMVEPDAADSNLARSKQDSTLAWVTWGNLRDTVATHVAGRSGDPRRASAQLGHSEGASMAIGHYIDPRGYVHAVVDNSEFLEELDPTKVGAKLEAAAS